MRLSTLSVLTIGLALSSSSQLIAQDFPKVLRIDRELIKEGKGAAHEKVEAGFARAFSKAKYVPYLALIAETGPNEAWFVEGHDSYASIDNMKQLTDKEPLKSQLDAQDGELRVNSSTMIAVLQPDLVVGPPMPGGWSKVRYFRIIVERYRVGPEWREMRAMEKAAREKMQPGRSGGIVYRVTSGAPLGTVLIVIPLISLKELDAPPGPMTFAEAMGAETNAKYRKLGNEVVISEEEFLFSVNPKMSNPSKKTVDGDPAFWAPKPAAPAKKTGAK